MRTTTLLQMLLTVMQTGTKGRLQMGSQIRTWRLQTHKTVRHSPNRQSKMELEQRLCCMSRTDHWTRARATASLCSHTDMRPEAFEE